MMKYNLNDFKYDYKAYAKYLDRKMRIANLKKKSRNAAREYLRQINCDNLIVYAEKKQC